MVPYLLFTLHLFLQSGPGVRHFLLKLLSDFLQVFLSLGGQGFYRFPGKEQKKLPVYSCGTIFHLNMIYAWYFFFFQFSTEHIILYSTVNWYLNHTCFFAILLAWPVFAFNILITFRCIYTVKHVWKYLRCLFQ